MMKKFFIFILLVFSYFGVFAQSKDARPSWMKTLPKAENNTFVYRVGHGFGKTREEAMQQAEKVVWNDVVSSSMGKIYNTQDIERAIQTDTALLSNNYYIKSYVNRVCDYGEKKDGGWVVWILCQVPRNPGTRPNFDFDFSGCNDNTDYKNGVAACLSIFIPGSGQMYMRHYGSGIFTMLGEIALVGGGVGSYFYAQKQLKTLNDFNTDYNTYMNAKDMYNNMRIASISCYCAAGALYIYNIIRAATMKPKFKKDKQKSVSLYPSVIPTQNYTSLGIGMTITLDKNQKNNYTLRNENE